MLSAKSYDLLNGRKYLRPSKKSPESIARKGKRVREMTSKDLERIARGNYHGQEEETAYHLMQARPEGRALLEEAVKATPEALRAAIDFLKARAH